MPFIKLVKEEVNSHKECKLPVLTFGRGVHRVGIGSIWECPICHKQYICQADGTGKSWNLLEDSQRVKSVDMTGEEDYTRPGK